MFLNAARSGDADTVIHCLAGGNVDANVNNAVSYTFSLVLNIVAGCFGDDVSSVAAL